MPLLNCGFDSRGVCALIRRGGSIEGCDGVVVGLAMLDGAVGVVGNLVRFGELFKGAVAGGAVDAVAGQVRFGVAVPDQFDRSEEHTSELQSLRHLVCRLLLEKK